MLAWSQFFGCFTLFILLAVFRARFIVWALVFGAFLLELTLAGNLHWTLGLMWPVYGAIVALGFLPMLRRKLISEKVFHFFKKSLPPVSDTEREAIAAGDIWWEAEMFRGHPNWQKLFQIPKPVLSRAEQSFIDNEVETLCAMINDWQTSFENHDMSPQVWDYLKANKFFGMNIPKQYNGLGFSALAQSAIVTKICTRSVTAAVTTMVPNSLGPGELLMHYGTDAQKQQYLPDLAIGKHVPCFALTGPEAGSDAGAIPDIGIVCKGQWEGQEILGMRLTWDKRYITLAPVATLLGLAIKLYDPDHLLGKTSDLGITLCLIPTETDGVNIGDRHLPLGLAFMNGPTSGKDVFMPLDWIIGGPKMAGQGWRMLMECLSAGRGISLPALSTATGHLCFRMTGAYASIRKQFNMSIGKFEGVEEVLSRIGGYTYLLEATRRFTAGAIDQDMSPAVVTAIAKYHMTEWGRIIVCDSMDIHAGRAIMSGPRNYLSSGYQGMPLSITVEGANILTRNLMIFGQGAIRCHPYIFQEMEAAQAEDKVQGLKMFDKLLAKHIHYSFCNAIRCWVFGLLAGPVKVSSQLPVKYHRYFRKLTWMSAGLATCSDLAMLVLGGQLKRKERLSARLGDVLSYLYVASALIKYHADEGNTEEDTIYLRWGLQTCLYKIQEAFFLFFDNFPIPVLGRVLRYLVFPWGRVFAQPNDHLSHQVGSSMLMPSAFRDRLSQYCYRENNTQCPTGILDIALEKMAKCMPAERKLQEAMKLGLIDKSFHFNQKIKIALQHHILTTEEASLLQEYEAIRKEAIAVDSFLADYLNQRKQTSCPSSANSAVA